VTLTFALTLTLLGIAGSFVSGLVGVGGAIVMIPLLYYVPPLLAVGSLDIKHVAGVTMAQVLAASLVGAWTHGRGAKVHPKLAVIGGTAMALGSLVGAVASTFVTGHALLTIFALMATSALPLMFVRPEPASGESPARSIPFPALGAIAYPGAIGIGSGLVGAGGAFLLVPVLIALLRVPVRVSIGTSLAMTALSASAGFLGKTLTAQVPLWPAVAVICGSFLGAPLGAQVSHRVPVAVLRVVLFLVIAAVAIRVWTDVLLR